MAAGRAAGARDHFRQRFVEFTAARPFLTLLSSLFARGRGAAVRLAEREESNVID